MTEQMTIYPAIVSFTRAPLGVNLEIALQRFPRGKCESCGSRRVLFAVGVVDVKTGPRLCAHCAGVR